jgi:NADPH:quinone reductase-like Zn-dependent oxidoreductase
VKAIVQDRYGTSGNLSLQEVGTPVPDATSVLLKVRSASVNGLDWRILSGRPLMGRLFFGLTRPKRRIRGVDVAGEVVAVRKADSRFKVGDQVFGLGSGSFAEFVAADESELVLKPDGVSFDDAATLGIAAVTALQGLTKEVPLLAGKSVAITGAASGVGSFAVQIAKAMGARVTAVSTSENLELLRHLGADVTVDYRKEAFPDASARYDLIFDISGRRSTGTLLRALRPGGRLVIVGGRGGMGRFFGAGLRRKILGQPVRGMIAHITVEDLTRIGELVRQGQVKPAVEQVYLLADAPRAMAHAERHQARGKLVIRVA